MQPIIYLYADESCLGNQYTGRASPGGAGVLLEYWRADSDPITDRAGYWERRELWVSEASTTNNRMALRSATEGLRRLKRPSRVILRSDSKYLVDGITKWLDGWIRKDWKRKKGPVKNQELWKALVPLLKRHQVDARWVRGHAGHPQNEYADHLAVRAAERQNASPPGFVQSNFTDWLEAQREHEKYLDFFEHLPPPEDEEFEPVSLQA